MSPDWRRPVRPSHRQGLGRSDDSRSRAITTDGASDGTAALAFLDSRDQLALAHPADTGDAK
jgi:hypothetical protein